MAYKGMTAAHVLATVEMTGRSACLAQANEAAPAATRTLFKVTFDIVMPVLGTKVAGVLGCETIIKSRKQVKVQSVIVISDEE